LKLPEIYGDVMTAFSPDKTQLVRAERRSEPHGNLWIYELQDGIPQHSPRKLTDDVGIASHPAYSPDGEWIVYYRIIKDQRDLWLVSSSGGQPVQLTDHSANDALPSWSPDGARIAFVSDREGSESVWLMNIEGTRSTGSPRMISQSGLSTQFPTWSRSGTEIAFVGLEGSNSEVWIASADGSSAPRRITDGAEAFRVQWDPASDQLLVSGTWGTGKKTLRSLSPDGKLVEEFSPPVVFGLSSAPGLFNASRDGKHLVFTRQNLMGDIWVLEATSGVY
jgi:TolB protein